MVIEIRRKVYDTLDVIGSRAMAELSATLEKHGLIEMRHYAESNSGSVVVVDI